VKISVRALTLAAQAESRAAVEVQATQWPIVTAFVMHDLPKYCLI